MNMKDKDFYKDLDAVLYDMKIALEFFRVVEMEIWENEYDELRMETKGVLTLAVDNYEKIFKRLSDIVGERINEP